MGYIITDTPPTEQVRQTQLVRLCRRYPFLSCTCVGKSVLGRELTALRLGESENTVLYAGGFHGSEWLTTSVLLTFVERLCEALERGGTIAGIDCRKALLGRGLTVMPCVNPDGVEISIAGYPSAGDLTAEVTRMAAESGCPHHSKWKANARGVDLNHNFDAGWHILRRLEQAEGINAPSPSRYGGERPESEPETRALTELCERMQPRYVLAFHSQGEEIYWHYGEKTPPRSALMCRVMCMSSGYAPAEPEGTASHGGFKDWFIEKYGRPGFTLELGRGENPLPPEQLMPIYSRLEELLTLCIYM